MNDCCRAGSTDKLEKMITPTNQLLSLLLLFFPSARRHSMCSAIFRFFFFRLHKTRDAIGVSVARDEI